MSVKNPTHKMKHGPAWIRILKSASGYVLQKDLANEIGLTPSTFSSYSSGRAAFPYHVVLQLIEVLNLDYIDVVCQSYGMHNCLEMEIITQSDAEEWIQLINERIRVQKMTSELESPLIGPNGNGVEYVVSETVVCNTVSESDSETIQ